jgi:hypothetical protein
VIFEAPTVSSSRDVLSLSAREVSISISSENETDLTNKLRNVLLDRKPDKNNDQVVEEMGKRALSKPAT